MVILKSIFPLLILNIRYHKKKEFVKKNSKKNGSEIFN